jgi:hypothetical protein
MESLFDQEFYDLCINYSQLEPDLKEFPKGD